MSPQENASDPNMKPTEPVVPVVPEVARHSSVPSYYWIAAVIILAAGVGLWQMAPSSELVQTQGTWGPPAKSLQTKSSAYSDATKLFMEGKYDAAVTKFIEAFEDTENRDQRSQITYKVALATEMGGDYLGAIRQYQLIINDLNNTKYVRAYAALRLANMITIPDAQEYVPQIFQAEPFLSFRVEGDREVTKKNMFEFVSSIYPLPQSELQIGTWHIGRALAGEDAEAHIAVALTKLESADADIPRIKSDENESSAMAEIMKRRAALIGGLASLGVKSHEEAVAAFEEALPLDTIANNGELGYVGYFYASYLARALGSEGAESVQAALRPYYTPTMRTSGMVVSFFAKERADRQEQKSRLVTLATLDPEFKKYLKSLGWIDIDFE